MPRREMPAQGKRHGKKRGKGLYLTTGKVAEMLEVSPAAIKKWIQQGKLPAFRTPGGHFRILADECERFQKNHGFVVGTGAPLRVLVVDDQGDVADVIGDLLRSFYPKAQVETAANGFEGLLKVGTFRPDVLLLDLAMPGIDGFEVCRQIKRDPAIRDTRIVAITAQLHDAEERAREAGADAFLGKPFEVDQVHTLLTRLFGRVP